MSAAPDDQAGRPQAHHVINIPMPARTIARGDGFSYAHGLDDNQQWTTSRRRDASSARGSDSRGRGLRSVVLQSVHMHRHAVSCSTPRTEQIAAASAFAQKEASGSRPAVAEAHRHPAMVTRFCFVADPGVSIRCLLWGNR